MRKYYWLLVVILFINFNCKGKKENNSFTEIKPKAVPVKVSLVKEKAVTETIKIIGEIAPLYRIDVFPKANGIVISESVSLGSKVHKDQLLAEVKQDIPGMDFFNVKIKAANDGWITMDVVEIGSRVSTQKLVYTISQLKPLYMIGKVIASQQEKIKIGDTVPVEVDAYPDVHFLGKITEISPVVDRISRMAELKITLKNSNLKLKPGMFASAFLKVGSHKALVIYMDSIVRVGANRYIFIVRNGKAVKVKVKTGVILGEEIEVSGDLQSGDKVVLMGQNLLEDGSPITIAEEK